jgi:RND family efflux transporter MFP subunit
LNHRFDNIAQGTSMNDEKRSELPQRSNKISDKKSLIFKIVLPIAILCVGLLGSAYLKSSGPKPQRKPPQKITSLVQVMPLQKTDETVSVRAMGTVVPAREMTLESRVSGEIVWMNPEFAPGGFLKAGEEALRIDPTDYQLDLARKKSQVADAAYRLKMELGHQEVAKREWQLLKGNKSAKDAELALRKPHLEKARADLAAARAELKGAELDLERTRITAPFNAVVRERHVELGSQVSTQEKLAELVGTDEYWVQVSAPVDRLRWLRIPRTTDEEGPDVVIRYGTGAEMRKGTLIKLLSDLEAEGRMARLLVSVKDPLDLSNPDSARPPLLIGEYVQAGIQGRELTDVFRIPRSALRDGARVWIAAPDDTLSIREVEALWRDSDTVLLRDGLQTGDRLILSDIAAPVAGMPLRVSDAAVSLDAVPLTGGGDSEG